MRFKLPCSPRGQHVFQQGFASFLQNFTEPRMDEIVSSVREKTNDAQLLLVAIDRQAGSADTDFLIKDANSSLIYTESLLSRLESKLSREPASVRQMMSFKIEQLKSDIFLIKNVLTKMTLKHENSRKRAEEKEELLKRRFTTNAETRVNLEFDEELKMNEKLTFSNNAIDQMLAQGAAVLHDLQTQKHFLYDVRKKFSFLTKSLTLSKTTLHFIDKRVREDKRIFITGVVCCLIFMFCFYRWWMG